MKIPSISTYPGQIPDIKLEAARYVMHITLIASICLAFNVLLLRCIVLIVADVVGRGKHVIVQIVSFSLVIVFLFVNKQILQLFFRLSVKT